MHKIKIILILFSLTVLLSSCGYTPRYAENKNINLSLKISNINGDREFNNFLKTKLKRYTENKGDDNKTFYLSISSKYKKSTTLRDSSGLAKEYKLEIIVDLNIKSENIDKKITLNETFNMKKMDNAFDESKYERTIKNNFADIVKEDLIFYLFKL